MAPQRASKKLWVLGLVVVGVVALLLVLPYLLSIERYKPMIVEALSEATGRDVEIETLRLHLLPSLRVQVVNLRVRNPRGFPEGDTVAAGSVDIGLAFWPLLSRRAEIDSITIEEVEANLLRNERGQTNHDFKLSPAKAAPEAEGAPPVSLARIDSVAVEDVKVSSGTFWSRQRKVFPSWTVTGINLELSNLQLEKDDWLKQAEADMDLSTIRVSVPALKEPLRFTGGELKVAENRAAGDFALALGSARAHGTMKVADLGNPVADFSLTMEELNVGELSKMAASEKAGGAGPASRGRGSRNLLARGTVKVGKVIVPPYSAQNVQGNVRLYGNRLVVNPFVLDVYGGKTKGDLLIDLDNPSVPARVNLNAKEVDVSLALAAADPKAADTITGTFETEGQLRLPLGAADPLTGVAGQGTFAVRDGTFPGLNVEGTLAKMAKFMAMDVPAGDTTFTYFGGDYRIADQRVHSRTLELQSDALEATLRGSFGFDQTLDYRGSGLLKSSGEGQQQEQQSSNPLSAIGRVFGKVVQQGMGATRMRVPFAVGGTFEDPKLLVTGPPTPLR